METPTLTATVLRVKIDAANNEAELRPLVKSYLGLILEHDIVAAAAARPSSGEELLLPQIIDRDRVAAAYFGHLPTFRQPVLDLSIRQSDRKTVGQSVSEWRPISWSPSFPASGGPHAC